MAQFSRDGFGPRTATVRLDSREFSNLVAEMMPGMLARATRLLLSREEARDVVQESLLIACAKLNQLREFDRFPGWLKSIVDSQCHRHLRIRGREVSLEEIERLEPLAPKALDPASNYERQSFLAAADQAFAKLSPPLQNVCRLYYQAGHSIEEIAEIIGVKSGAVRKRINSAGPLLMELMAGHLGDPGIRVGYLPISDHILGMVAHRLDSGRNSRIRMKRFLSWNKLANALTRGHIDAAFIMVPLAMQLCNSGVRLRYVLDGHHDGSALAAMTHDLKGKRVGVPGPYSTHRVLLGKLAHDFPGLWNNIATANTSPSYAIKSLKAQSIDAFFCAEPWITKCIHDGGADVVVRSKDVAPGHPCCVVAVREDFRSSHPDRVRDYVELLIKAREKLMADIAYCAETQAIYTGIQKEIAAQVLEDRIVTFEDLYPDKGRMAQFMEMALASGVLSKPCDLDEFVCTDFF